MYHEYYKVDERIHRIPKETLSWVLKLFYSRLAFRCNHKNKSWWSKKKLASDFQTTPRSIQRWLRELESLGLITVHQEGGSQNEISIEELSDDLIERLGDATPMSPPGRHGCLPSRDTGVSPSRKGKIKRKRKTVDGSAVRRGTFDSSLEDPDVISSGKSAVKKAKKRVKRKVKKSHTIETADSLLARRSPSGGAVPDDTTLGMWSVQKWSSAFVAAMQERGYSVTFFKYKAFANHVSSILSHLLNFGFSRSKIYRFLLMWFPQIYSDIQAEVFKKGSDDRMFSIAWMEPRLDKLVRMFEEDEEEDEEPTERVTV